MRKSSGPCAVFFRHALAAVALVMLLSQCTADPVILHSADNAALSGTFIQLREEHVRWTQDRWRLLFAEFRQLRLRRVVVQWSMAEKLAFFSSDGPRSTGDAPLETILRMADENAMEVMVGLAHSEDYWDRIGGSPGEVDKFLRQEFARSLSVAGKLLPLLSAHRSAKGWYVSEEIDDLNWRNIALRRVLATRLGALTKSLHLLDPRMRIAISGYASGSRPAAELQVLWGELLDAAPHLDSVLFQDGIGVGHLTLRRLPEFLTVMQTVTQARGRNLEVITEVFRQLAGYPLNDQPFHAVPAPIERIERQLQIATRYSGMAIAFSAPEYLSSGGGEEAAQLYLSYVTWLRRSGQDQTNSPARITNIAK